MELKIRITTPRGRAKSAEKKLRPFLLGHKPKELYTNEDDNEILWVIEGSVKKCFKIQRNVLLYEKLMAKMLDNRVMKKVIKKHIDNDGQKELNKMLLEQTKIEVLKSASQEEWKDYETPWWERLKQKFKKEEVV